jgi:hypothetical protein
MGARLSCTTVAAQVWGAIFFILSGQEALEKSIACRPCEQPAMTDDVQDGTVAPFA